MNFQKQLSVLWKIRLVLNIKNVASFIKTGFYRKRGCIKTRKHIGNCHISANFSIFKTKVCGKRVNRYLHENETLLTLSIYMTKNHFSILSNNMKQNGDVFSPWGPVFLTSLLFKGLVISQFQGPDAGPILSWCLFFLKQMNKIHRKNLSLKSFFINLIDNLHGNLKFEFFFINFRDLIPNFLNVNSLNWVEVNSPVHFLLSFENWADVLKKCECRKDFNKFSFIVSDSATIETSRFKRKHVQMLRVLPIAVITATLLVTVTVMIIRPRSLLQHKKLTNTKCKKLTDFKLSLNLGVTYGSLLVNWQIISITSLRVLFQNSM